MSKETIYGGPGSKLNDERAIPHPAKKPLINECKHLDYDEDYICCDCGAYVYSAAINPKKK